MVRGLPLQVLKVTFFNGRGITEKIQLRFCPTSAHKYISNLKYARVHLLKLAQRWQGLNGKVRIVNYTRESLCHKVETTPAVRENEQTENGIVNLEANVMALFANLFEHNIMPIPFDYVVLQRRNRNISQIEVRMTCTEAQLACRRRSIRIYFFFYCLHIFLRCICHRIMFFIGVITLRCTNKATKV